MVDGGVAEMRDCVVSEIIVDLVFFFFMEESVNLYEQCQEVVEEYFCDH